MEKNKSNNRGRIRKFFESEKKIELEERLMDDLIEKLLLRFKRRRVKEIELEEKLIDSLTEEVSREQNKLEEMKDKIMKNRIFEALNLKEINKEMLNEEELLEETEEKLFGMTYRIIGVSKKS